MIVKAQRRGEGERAETRGTALMGEAREADPNFVLRETSALGTREKSLRRERAAKMSVLERGQVRLTSVHPICPSVGDW